VVRSARKHFPQCVALANIEKKKAAKHDQTRGRPSAMQPSVEVGMNEYHCQSLSRFQHKEEDPRQ